MKQKRNIQSIKSKKDKSIKSLPLAQKIVFGFFLYIFYFLQVICFTRKLTYRSDEVNKLSRTNVVKLFDFWLFNTLKIRKDENSKLLLESLPFVSVLLLQLSRTIILLGKIRLQVYQNSTTDFERRISRTSYFDEKIFNSKEKQIIFVGSQLCTRSFSQARKKVYELDVKKAFRHKKSIKTYKYNSIYVNFQMQNLDQKGIPSLKTILLKKGWKEYKDSLFILEEVFSSNRKDLVSKFLDEIAQIRKSKVLLDYFDASAINFFSLFFLLVSRNMIINGIKSKNKRKNVEKYFKSYGFQIEEHVRLKNLNYGLIYLSTKRKKNYSSSDSTISLN
eukprot:snap_masked-scaffold_22-processed-gene-1.4-mRNA-1 protein AED:1.00 eAED:1.00 QI:0/0/0/0/1/1/2/0/332